MQIFDFDKMNLTPLTPELVASHPAHAFSRISGIFKETSCDVCGHRGHPKWKQQNDGTISKMILV